MFIIFASHKNLRIDDPSHTKRGSSLFRFPFLCDPCFGRSQFYLSKIKVFVKSSLRLLMIIFVEFGLVASLRSPNQDFLIVLLFAARIEPSQGGAKFLIRPLSD